MSKMKLRWIAVAAIAVLFVLTMGFAFGAMPAREARAEALTYTPSAIFSSSGSGSSVDSSEKGSEEDAKSFVRFSYTSDSAAVSYRRDLALKWFESAKPAEEEGGAAAAAEGGLANPGKAAYYSMTFAFSDLAFQTFTIRYEAAEENISKDGKSSNSVVFTYADDALKAELRNASYVEDKDETHFEAVSLGAYAAGTDIAIRFDETDCSIGEFAVYVKVGEAEEVSLGKFTNIGGNYLEYRSVAATTPSTPITFEVKLKEAAEGEERASQHVLMKSLNGQSFETDSDGKVVDNANAVLVLNEEIYSFRLGQRFSLTYEAIDVCDDSVTPVRSYYMLKKNADGSYLKPNEYNDDDYQSLTTSTFFLPTADNEAEEEAYVSIRFRLDDGTHTDYYVYLTWYAANGGEGVVKTFGNSEEAYYLCPKCGKHYTLEEYNSFDEAWTCPEAIGENHDESCTSTKEELKYENEDAFDYIVVTREAQGPSFIGVTAPSDEEVDAGAEAKNTVTDLAEARKTAYQEELDKAAEGVSAGDGAYLYLPSLRGLISSEYADYRNLRFSIYYYKPGQSKDSSASSSTSLRYNNLRLEVDEEGSYRFRVIAQDAAGNAMQYYDEDGDLTNVTSSNVWDIEGIPEFTFYIHYSGPSIEDAGEQSPGYRDDSYSITDFEIVAVDGYEKEYSLYYFDEEMLGEHATPTYDELVEMLEDGKELESWVVDCLKEINVYDSEVSEDDAEWDKTDNASHWDPDSSLSFVPQETGFYFVKITVKDARLVNRTVSAYQVIEVRNPRDNTPGESNWLRNNLTAVILFGISAVLLVAIIVLSVIKPAEKTVEEVDLSTLKGKKEKKNKTEKKS